MQPLFVKTFFLAVVFLGTTSQSLNTPQWETPYMHAVLGERDSEGKEIYSEGNTLTMLRRANESVARKFELCHLEQDRCDSGERCGGAVIVCDIFNVTYYTMDFKCGSIHYLAAKNGEPAAKRLEVLDQTESRCMDGEENAGWKIRTVDSTRTRYFEGQPERVLTYLGNKK